MLASEFITGDVPSLKPGDTGSKALNWMEEFKVSHLPVVKGTEYLGLISENDIMDFNKPVEEIGTYSTTLLKPFIFESQHVYEVLKMISYLNITVLPVLNESMAYLGLITVQNLTLNFSKMAAVQEPGGIIVLELNHNDYSLTQIAQIVEGNNARILSCYITNHADSTKMEITLKINKIDLSGVLQTFNRYNYTVKASFHQSSDADDLKDRYNSLMNYINL
jgi:acetoin utilization protein AcuB